MSKHATDQTALLDVQEEAISRCLNETGATYGGVVQLDITRRGANYIEIEAWCEDFDAPDLPQCSFEVFHVFNNGHIVRLYSILADNGDGKPPQAHQEQLRSPHGNTDGR